MGRLVGLGRLGFEPGTWSDEAMVLDAIKELYRLQGDSMSEEEEKFYKKEIATYNKFECLNKLRKLNSKIKKLGGNVIERKNVFREKYKKIKEETEKEGF